MPNAQQLDNIKTGGGFIAALDQSGGSTPKALANYGIDSSAFENDAQMLDIVHQMRTRIITSPSFGGDRVMGSILFENTMEREIEGLPTADYLWTVKGVVPFLKIDKGLADEVDGMQFLKPMPDLDSLLSRAKGKNIFGTKMRSVMKRDQRDGIDAIVTQQFEIGRQIIAASLVPIIEPEVDINSPRKSAIEDMLKGALLKQLNQLEVGQLVMLKLTLPEIDDFYLECVKHPNVLKVVALSGGYSREEANQRLARQKGMAASFSRALSEGLNVAQSDDEFNAMLNSSIESIVEASRN